MLSVDAKFYSRRHAGGLAEVKTAYVSVYGTPEAMGMIFYSGDSQLRATMTLADAIKLRAELDWVISQRQAR